MVKKCKEAYRERWLGGANGVVKIMCMGKTEADTRANRIEPVLRAAGWGVVEGAQARRELICPGRSPTRVRTRARDSTTCVVDSRAIHPWIASADRGSTAG